MKKKMKTDLSLLLALLLVVALFSTAALAEGKSMSLTVKLPDTAEEELKKADITVNLYRIASLADTSVPAAGKYDYALLPGFEGLNVDIAGAEADALLELAEKALEIVTGSSLEPAAVGTILTGEDSVTFSNLEAGLYLVETPDVWDENNALYRFTAFIAPIPAPDENGTPCYNVTAVLKYERTDKSRILIIKDLPVWYDINSGYTEPVNTLFVFEVTAKMGEVTVYNDVLSMDFQSPGEKSITIDGLPVGAEVTVTEVYSGGKFTLKTVAVENVEEGEYTVALPGATAPVNPLPNSGEPDNTTTFRFTNEFNHGLITSGGVVNVFDKAEDTWIWHQERGNGNVDLTDDAK